VLRITLPPLYPWESSPGFGWTGNWLGPGVGLGTETKRILCPAIIKPRISFYPMRSLVTAELNISDSQRFDRILTLIASFFCFGIVFMSCFKFQI